MSKEFVHLPGLIPSAIEQFQVHYPLPLNLEGSTKPTPFLKATYLDNGQKVHTIALLIGEDNRKHISPILPDQKDTSTSIEQGVDCASVTITDPNTGFHFLLLTHTTPHPTHPKIILNSLKYAEKSSHFLPIGYIQLECNDGEFSIKKITPPSASQMIFNPAFNQLK